MKNFIQKGDTITHTPAGAVTSGQAIRIGHMIGVAVTDVAAGEAGAFALTGVYELPKVSAAEFPQGSKLLWDESAGAFDAPDATPASGDLLGAAVAIEAGTNGQTTIKAKIGPSNATLTP